MRRRALMTAAFICAKTTDGPHPAARRGLRKAQWRNTCLPHDCTRPDAFAGMRPMAVRPAIGPKVARLVRLLHTLKLGFTRRHVAFGDCGKCCGRPRQARCCGLRRQDKELET